MYIKSGTSTWKNTAALYIKSGASVWSRVRQGYIKTSSTLWKRFFFEANLPTVITLPTIRTTNNSGTGTIYDGPVASSPKYLNDNLFGKDGSYSNYTSITSRKFSSATSLEAATRSTVVFDDRFTSAGGVTTSMRISLDEQYLFYEVQVNNGTGDDYINPVCSNPIKMIKSFPVANTYGWTGQEAIGIQLAFNYNVENYYYNSLETGSSYVRWWRSTNTNPGGTLLKEDTIDSTSTSSSSSSLSGTSYYTPTSSDNGYYIVAQIIAVSSYTRHNGYTDNYSLVSFPTGAPVTGPLEFSNVLVKDYYDQKGLDNRDRWPTGTLNKYSWVLSNYDPANTVIRVRYRVYNFDTGLYWNPYTGAQTSASASYASWSSDGSGLGYISNIDVNGTTATCYDYFDLSSNFFNGGGSPTWGLEIELSAIKSGGTRVYYVNPYESFYISKRIDPTVSVSPSTAGLNSNVTISGTFAGFPATPSTNAYPRQYIVYYGDGNNSGYLPVGEWANSTLNPTYSLTKSYSTAGTYTVTVRAVPYGADATATVTVSSTKVPPTMGTPTISAVGAFVSGQRRLSVPFTAVANSGPSYQIYWYPGADYAGNPKPPVSASIDGSGTTSPILDESGPNGIGRYAVWIRSSAANNTTGTTAPSTTLSDWSDLQYVYISGTRTLSYSKNTTDTVGSLPSNASGTDPWDGWVTNVSSNTPTRDGHTFNGYNTAADGTGTNYAAGASITLTSDITLYAKWTANTYSVTYDGNGNTGGSVPDSQTKTHGVNLTLRTNVNSLTKTNYTFDGWNTSSDGSGTSYASGATYSGNANLTLYAKWASSVTLYTVTFSANGASGSPSVSSVTQTTSGGSVTLATIGTMSSTGNIFGGWRTGTSSGTVYAFGASFTPTSNITLYAYYGATPTCVAPAWGSGYFTRNNTNSEIIWYTDFPTPSGAVQSILSMQFQISTTQSTTGILIGDSPIATRAYPGSGTYPYSGGGTIWAFKCGRDRSSVGQVSDISFSTAARYARARVRMLGIDGVTYVGTYSAWF